MTTPTLEQLAADLDAVKAELVYLREQITPIVQTHQPWPAGVEHPKPMPLPTLQTSGSP